MKLMVIDGNSIINRSFYGVRPLTTREGVPTNAVYGFVTTLLRLLDEDGKPVWVANVAAAGEELEDSEVSLVSEPSGKRTHIVD